MKKVFLHSLSRRNMGLGIGWYAPSELSGANQGLCFAIPVDQKGQLASKYVCEIANVLQDGSQEWQTGQLLREDNYYSVSLGSEAILFKERRTFPNYRVLQYKGVFKHPDFKYGLVELKPFSEQHLDEIFLETGLVLVGCNPESYRGVELN
jgi:hypothetical protein